MCCSLDMVPTDGVMGGRGEGRLLLGVMCIASFGFLVRRDV